VGAGEGAGGGEGGGLEERGDGGGGELITVFSVDALAGGEVKGEGWAGAVGGDVDGLGGERLEVDFDAGVGRIPEGAVEKAVGVEVGT
jgi:hypothetical protein